MAKHIQKQVAIDKPDRVGESLRPSVVLWLAHDQQTRGSRSTYISGANDEDKYRYAQDRCRDRGSGIYRFELRFNIFYGQSLSQQLQTAAQQRDGATVFAYQVQDPERYGVVEFNETGRAIGLEVKPKLPRSHFAVTSLYFHDHSVADYAAKLEPPSRGEA